ncbi:MAG: hypothetical protein ACE5GY_07090 [Thermodesulfobacteriota bacterium]
MKQQFRKDIVGTFKAYVFENNRKVSPTSATLTVYKPGSTDKLIDAQAMTVAVDGLLSYSLTAVNNADLGENYQAEVSYVLSGTTYTFTQFYDVVRSVLTKVITDADLEAELPQLKERNWTVRGTADSGSATTIVDANLKRHDDDFFTGGLAYSHSKDETREITGFASSTGTVTTAAFSAAIAPGEKYTLMRSYSIEIQRAFEKIDDWLRRKGKRPQLVLDPYDLREVHILLSVAEVCKGATTEGEGAFWWEMWKAYEHKADASFGSLNLKYDSSNDGHVSGKEVGSRSNTIRVRF